MSSFLTPAVYSKNGLENQWINCIWNTHDLMCGCNDAIKHLFTLLKKKQSLPCLPSTEGVHTGTQTGADTEEDVLEEGDLDKLFEEDFDEEDG